MWSSHVCFMVDLLPLHMFSRSGYCAGQERGFGSLSGQMSGGLGTTLTSHAGPSHQLCPRRLFHQEGPKVLAFSLQPCRVGENQERVKTKAKRSQSVTLRFLHLLSHQECAARSKIKQADMTSPSASFSPFLQKCCMMADREPHLQLPILLADSAILLLHT